MATHIVFPSLDVETDDPNLAKRSVLVQELLDTQASAEMTVPSWISKSMLLRYLEPAKGGDLNTAEAVKLCRVACFMKDDQLESQLLASSALNELGPQTALALYDLAVEFKDRSQQWNEYFKQTRSYAVTHIAAILGSGAIGSESILLECLKTPLDPSTTETVIKALKTLWKCSTITELLEELEKVAKENVPSTVVLTWSPALQSSTRFYQSPEFEIQGQFWTLHLWHYPREDRLDCLLASGTSQRNVGTGELVALTLALSFSAQDCVQDTRVITLFSGSKGERLVRNLFGLKARSESVCLTVKARMEPAFASVFTHISHHFEAFHSSEKLGRLSGDRILQLFAMKQLQTSSEDAVLRVIGQWSERNRKGEDLQLKLENLLDSVKWPYVSIAALVDCARLFPVLKTSGVFRAAVSREFSCRSSLGSRKSDPPRPAYADVPPHNQAASLSVFLGDLCQLITELDYTPVHPEDQILITTLRQSLQAKELQAKYLRDSLSIVQRVTKSNRAPSPGPSIAHSPVRSLVFSPEFLKGEEKNLSYTRETLSTMATKSGKRNSLDLSDDSSAVEGKVGDMLRSLWSKLEGKAGGE